MNVDENSNSSSNEKAPPTHEIVHKTQTTDDNRRVGRFFEIVWLFLIQKQQTSRTDGGGEERPKGSHKNT